MKKLLALPAMFLTGAASAFADAPTLPTPLGDGVTLSDYITVAIGGLGGIVVTVIGGYFAFKLIKIGLRWVGRIGA